MMPDTIDVLDVGAAPPGHNAPPDHKTDPV